MTSGIAFVQWESYRAGINGRGLFRDEPLTFNSHQERLHSLSPRGDLWLAYDDAMCAGSLPVAATAVCVLRWWWEKDLTMTIQIDLAPDEENSLRERAAARGEPPEVLAAELLRAQLVPAPAGSGGDHELPPVRDENGVFRPERLDAVLKRCAELSADLPYLPPEALTREALYQDRD